MPECKETLGKKPGGRTLEGIPPCQVVSQLTHLLETGYQDMGKYGFILHCILVSVPACMVPHVAGVPSYFL